jgi:hypothetical protein
MLTTITAVLAWSAIACVIGFTWSSATWQFPNSSIESCWGFPCFGGTGEIGCHPDEEAEAGKPARFELAFICKDLDATVADLKKRGVKFVREIHDAGWGLTSFRMLGTINAVLYEPHRLEARQSGRTVVDEASPCARQRTAATSIMMPLCADRRQASPSAARDGRQRAEP